MKIASMAAGNTAAIAFVELPSADRKPPRQRGGFFLERGCCRGPTKKEALRPPFPRRPASQVSAKNAEGMQHPEGQKCDHQNAGDHRVGPASRIVRGRHEFQAPCIRGTTHARAQRMPCGNGAAHRPELQCRYACAGNGVATSVRMGIIGR